MPRSTLIRTIFVAVMAAAIATVALPQSQDSQSVAEAARKAREKKKDAAKPTKVITDENLDVKKGDVQSAVAEEPKIAGAPDTKAQTPSGSAANASTQASRDEKLKKEVEAVKQQLKEALSDLDLLQRENRLDQDEYYSKPNFASDTAGKQKLDDEQQQIGNKRQEVERLK